MWLADSLLTCDLVVSGTPQRQDDDAVLHVQDPASTLTLCPPYRCAFGKAGQWLLLRTQDGYFILNPDENPLAGLSQPPDAKAADPAQDDPTLPRRIAFTDRAGQSHERVITTTASDAGVATEVTVDGKRILQRSFDEAGRLATVFRLNDNGDGFNLAYEAGRLYSYTVYASGERQGLSREYYRHKPTQLREEIHWQAGLRHGRCRTWDENGQLLTDARYDHGLIAPVVRYAGPATEKPIVTMYTTDAGVFYRAHAPLESVVKPGMTTAEVSAALKVDFSPQAGLTFPSYATRRLLHIAFKDGRVAALRQADNTACFEPAGTGPRR